MPSYDFEVDLESLAKAAQGAADTIQLFKDKDVEDLVPEEGDLGSDVVWDAVDEFKDRWERGTKDMAEDIEEVSGRLGKVAMNYGEFDKSGSDLFTSVADTARGVHLVDGGHA